MEKIIYPYFNYQGTLVVSEPMQDHVLSIQHLRLLSSKKRLSITIRQFPTGTHPKRLKASTVSSHCFQLCLGRLEPCQLLHITSILVIEKGSSPVTVVNDCCLLEGVISLIEWFQGLITKPRETRQFRIQSCGTSLTNAGQRCNLKHGPWRGVIKHTQFQFSK